MNILYLHGLDSKLSDEKRAILEEFGKVLAPDLNYYKDPRAVETVLGLYSGEEVDCVIGSSMGGYAGYHVANALNRPALLFNPALAKRSVPQELPAGQENLNNYKQILIGQQDEVVDPRDTFQYLSENFNTVTDLHLHAVPQLGHNILPDVFRNEVKSFFEKLSR